MSPNGIAELKAWLDAGLAFFYPDLCQICRAERATAPEGYVCGRCQTGNGGIRFIEAPFCERCGLPFEGDITTSFECSNCREMELHFRWARASVVATPLILEVVHRYKYQRALWFEPFLAALLLRQVPHLSTTSTWDFIVPVPLHPLKKREREFNQAERLAAYLSRAAKIPVNARLVRRVEFTRTQTMLCRSERAANVLKAFSVPNGDQLQGKQIILIDDVLTTGATTSACAGALRAAGARDVCVCTVARGILK